MSRSEIIEDDNWAKTLTSQQLCRRLRNSGKPTLLKIADIFEDQELDGEDITTIMYEELCEILPKLGMRKKLQKFMAEIGVSLPYQVAVAKEGNIYLKERPKKNDYSEAYPDKRPKKKRRVITPQTERRSSQQSRKLYIWNIPSHRNNIANINSFFSRWGTLSHLEVLPGQHKAQIQYSTLDEAKRCFWDCQERDVMGDPKITVEFAKNSHIKSTKDTLATTKGKKRRAAAKPGNTVLKPPNSSRKARVSTGDLSDSREKLQQLAEKYQITVEGTERILRTAEILRRSVYLDGLPRCRSKAGLRALVSDLQNILREQCNLRSKYFEIHVRQEKSSGRVLLSSEKADSVYEVLRALDGKTLERKFVISAKRDHDIARFLRRSRERGFFIKIRPLLEENFYPTLSDKPARLREPCRRKTDKPRKKDRRDRDSDWELIEDNSRGLETLKTSNEELGKGKHVQISGGDFDGKFGVIVEPARKKSKWLVRIDDIGQFTLHEKMLRLVLDTDRNPPPPLPSNSIPSEPAFNPQKGGWTILKEGRTSAPLSKKKNTSAPIQNHAHGIPLGTPEKSFSSRADDRDIQGRSVNQIPYWRGEGDRGF